VAKVMMTVELDPAGASTEQAAKRLGVPKEKLDGDFGVVNIDPEKHLYAVLLDEDVAAGVSATEGVSGPYSNPPIEPFGPPRREP
jgi:hypothetical protein